MQPDRIIQPTLHADIVAVADLLMEWAQTERKPGVRDLCFLSDALVKIAMNAEMADLKIESLSRQLLAAQARVTSLTTPDDLKRMRESIAIRDGRAAGKVIDLRAVFLREQAERPVPAQRVDGETA